MFIIYNIYNIWYLYRICLYNVFFTSIISIISKQDCGDAVEPTSAGLHRGDAGENPWFYSRWSSGLAADSRSKSLWNIIFTSFSRHFHRSLADSVPCCAMLCQGSKSRANFWSSLLRRLLASGAQFFILFQGMTSHDFKNLPSTIQIRDGQSVYVKCESRVFSRSALLLWLLWLLTSPEQFQMWQVIGSMTRRRAWP